MKSIARKTNKQTNKNDTKVNIAYSSHFDTLK